MKIKSQAKPQTSWEHIQAFKSAITWDEPFIISIVVFQIIMLVATYYVTRRNRGLVPRVIYMIIIAATVRSAEYLNGIGTIHWQQIATQNYFDRQGIFMMIMICVPLLFDSFIMLVCCLREASDLLIQVKTKQIKKELKGTNKGKKDDATTKSETKVDKKQHKPKKSKKED